MRTYSIAADELLKRLSQTKGGSDLILTAGKPPQFKVHGEVVPVPNTTPLDDESVDEVATSVLTKDQVKRFRREQELDLSLHLPQIGRFRVNFFRQRGATGMVARIVMEKVPGFLALGLPPIIEELAKLRKGLVLFTGPTGHGKSTSVASVVDFINENRACHIVCIEDPIEYVHKHKRSLIEQREVGIDTESFHAALRRVLRQAPDVIMIGEIRDRESAQVAMTLAETGHLILATLHTSGAIASVNRLIDMFPTEQEKQMRSQLSASLAAVIWQQLLPKSNNEGLTLACEVMVVIPAIRSLIRQGRIHEVQSLIQTGRKHGMFTMDQAIEELAAENRIDPEWLQTNYLEMPVGLRKMG
jgi:twitching motility protein PilT